SQLWGETFSRAASAVGQLEAEIAKQIAGRLKQRLTNAEERQIAKNSGVDAEAHDLYLRGRYFHLKSGNRVENLQKAIDLFNQAVSSQPNYALAYVGIADSNYLLIANSVVDPEIGKPKVEAALTKALELDDTLPEAYATLGMFETSNWNWAKAEN